jgi:hypothetical protein
LSQEKRACVRRVGHVGWNCIQVTIRRASGPSAPCTLSERSPGVITLHSGQGLISRASSTGRCHNLSADPTMLSVETDLSSCTPSELNRVVVPFGATLANDFGRSDSGKLTSG